MNKKKKICSAAFFVLLFVLYTAVTAYLFYHQAYGDETSFHSDMKAYILEMQGLESGYDFPYPVFFRLGAFFALFLTPQVAITVALTLLNSASLIALRLCMGAYCKKTLQGKYALLASMGLSLLCLCLFLVSMLFSVTGISLPGIYHRYKGVFTPNPYHNATYLAVRPFAILTLFVFADLLKSYEEKFSVKKGLCFAGLLFLATMTKPSFTLVFVAAAGLWMLVRFLQKKGKNLKESFALGLCFLPTFGALLYQYKDVFVADGAQEAGVGFGFLVAWQYHADNVFLAILLAAAFPLAVFVFHFKAGRKDVFYCFSCLYGLMGLLSALFLYEKGFRIGDMNFCWGYMHGLFFAFVAAAGLLWKETLQAGKKSPAKWGILGGEWLLFLWHLGCGLLYFKNFLAGFLYY